MRWFFLAVLCLVVVSVAELAAAGEEAARVVWPMGRSAYFVGERVPMAVVSARPEVTVEAVGPTGAWSGRVLLYRGKPGTLLADTTSLAPGDYEVELDGSPTGQRLTITAVVRRSVGSMQDESLPGDPQFPNDLPAVDRGRFAATYWENIVAGLRESGLNGAISWGAPDAKRMGVLDVMARAGVVTLVNPDTRPTSFFPVGNNPAEIDGMSQRLIAIAQANDRYPNFGGFCYGWDTTGYAQGGRRGLLIYWGWGDKTEALRGYIDRNDAVIADNFRQRTGMQPVTQAEYISYLVSIGKAELAPAIDLPTKRWLEEIARYAKPMPEGERAVFEKRLDAWGQYLMGLYRECYREFQRNLRASDPTLRGTASVQIDHAPTREGQYFPWSYEPLDFRYQSTWNDQVGGPDYSYQWLLTAGLLDMERPGGVPTWLSNAHGFAHGRATYPGKFARVAAHGLAWGVTGIGFALEGFSNLNGGMNREANWSHIRAGDGGADVEGGREFLDRFASLALEGRGDHRVAVLFPRTQYGRQHVALGYGQSLFKTFVTLVRLGYTPKYMTEDELVAGKGRGLEALIMIGQTEPLPAKVHDAIDGLSKLGTRILVDGATTAKVPGARVMTISFPASVPGKPHNWGTPNMAPGENDAILMAREHPQLAAAFSTGLGDVGRGLLRSARGPATETSLMQIDGGRGATYIVAVNDSQVISQADWRQVRETIEPTGRGPAVAYLYDCTDERAMGPLRSFECDLTRSTARVYAVLPREIKSIRVRATQSVTAGDPLRVTVEFRDSTRDVIKGVLPFEISLRRPDGSVLASYFRSTDQAGVFSMSVPTARNAPPGEWTLAARSQLNGDEAILPITIAASKASKSGVATPWNDKVITRRADTISKAFTKGGKVVIPVFDGPRADAVLKVAERAKTLLSKRGLEVEIVRNPKLATYTLAYTPTPEQSAENTRIEKSGELAKIARQTLNHNDWYGGECGFFCSRNVLLLDVTAPIALSPGLSDKPAPGGNAPPPLRQSNPPATALGSAGMLWPEVSEAFPGKGRAVLQGVEWAFAPRASTVVVQAFDVDGLGAGVEYLTSPGADVLTPSIRETRADLWRERRVGGVAETPKTSWLSERGLRQSSSPRPWAQRFVSDIRPPVERPVPAAPERPAKPAPAKFAPADFTPFLLVDGKYIESGTASMLVPDLRFSDALGVVLNNNAAAKMKLTLRGVFRYSDRQPCWQAQWEDILNLRDKLIPKARGPMTVSVLLNGKHIGDLAPSKTEVVNVKLEMMPRMGPKAATADEEVVTMLQGELELPAGRVEILFAPRNIVDGKVTDLFVGMEPPPVQSSDPAPAK